MSGGLGTVCGSKIGKNRDGDSNVRLLDTEISSPEDIQTTELINTQGEDFNPEDEDVVLVIPITIAYKLGLLIDDGVEPDPTIEKGEKEIYSKAAGARLAKIRLNKDGEIILNGGADFAAKFTDLKTGFDQLRTDLNTALAALFLPPSTASIDSAKVNKVRL